MEAGVQGLAEPFHRLRELSHRDGEGTWFSCELRLTPEAADAMETETVLAVDLNLEAGEIERLRTVLGMIFHAGASDLMPSLMGF
ncbi:hypothetical protein FHR32_005346 [Streptosporangium album]|uniref:Uncharacterized protein n=1 Tax=Streptosporangium album TaxID=47479 RepID=A0A7W7RZ90_9ACTN|nr:hypothetical protein [Streptosporangium album]MBB4940969.1 hypothetical protein [Streptosporangium album]